MDDPDAKKKPIWEKIDHLINQSTNQSMLSHKIVFKRKA
jgi:hypothetical protein